MRIDRGEKFDIIFCDMAMSHMDGATAMQHVREHEKHTGTHTPIVLMTAYAEPGSHTKAGFDRVIHKPVDLNEVERAVRELVLAPRSGCYRLQPALVIDLPKLQRRCAGKTRTILRVLDSFIDAAEDQINQLSQPMIALERDMLLASITSVQRLLEDSVEPDRYGTIDTFCGKLRDPSYEPADDLPSVIRLIESACNNARALRQELADAAAK